MLLRPEQVKSAFVACDSSYRIERRVPPLLAEYPEGRLTGGTSETVHPEVADPPSPCSRATTMAEARSDTSSLARIDVTLFRIVLSLR